MQYWLDGTSAGTLNGAFSGSSTFDHMEFGDVVLATGTTNGTGTIYWDELVVSNFYNGTGIASPVTYFRTRSTVGRSTAGPGAAPAAKRLLIR